MRLTYQGHSHGAVRTVMVLAAMVAASSGCSSTRPQSRGEGSGADVSSSSRSQVDVQPGTAREEPRKVAPPPSVDSSALESEFKVTIRDGFFGFDRYDLTDEARQALSSDADWLSKHAGSSIVVEGHCDERGSREYNLALGEKRAAAVVDYLVNLGVDRSRFRVVSYGKEKPFETGHDEASWSKNRRAHFVLSRK